MFHRSLIRLIKLYDHFATVKGITNRPSNLRGILQMTMVFSEMSWEAWPLLKGLGADAALEWMMIGVSIHVFDEVLLLGKFFITQTALEVFFFHVVSFDVPL